MNWNILYAEIVEAWLTQLEKQQFKAIAKELRLLELCGNQLKLPHSKSLGRGLFELRERKFGLRIYYGYAQGTVILLLYGGNKQTQKKDIKEARKLLKEHKKENDHESKKFSRYFKAAFK